MSDLTTVKITDLATAGITLSDWIVKADADGYATKNSVQTLADVIGASASVTFGGSLAIADTPSADGWYFATEDGVYTNCDDIDVDLNGKITIIIVSDSQTVFSSFEVPVNFTIAEDGDPMTGSSDVFKGSQIITQTKDELFSETPVEDEEKAFTTGGAFTLQSKVIQNAVSNRNYFIGELSSLQNEEVSGFNLFEIEAMKVVSVVEIEYVDKTKKDEIWQLNAFSNNFSSPYEYYFSIKNQTTSETESIVFDAGELSEGYAEFTMTSTGWVGGKVKVWFDYSQTTEEGLLISSSALEHNIILKAVRSVYEIEDVKTTADANESDISTLQSDVVTNSLANRNYFIGELENLQNEEISGFNLFEVETMKVISGLEVEYVDKTKKDEIWQINAFSNNFTSPFEYYLAIKNQTTGQSESITFDAGELSAGYAEFTMSTTGWVGGKVKVWFDYSQTTEEGLLISSSASEHNIILKAVRSIYEVEDVKDTADTNETNATNLKKVVDSGSCQLSKMLIDDPNDNQVIISQAIEDVYFSNYVQGREGVFLRTFAYQWTTYELYLQITNSARSATVTYNIALGDPIPDIIEMDLSTLGTDYENVYFQINPSKITTTGLLQTSSGDNLIQFIDKYRTATENQPDTAQLQEDIEDLQDSRITSPWAGKSIVWVGTSIPANQGGGYVYDESYPRQVGEYLGATVNNASNGGLSIHLVGTQNTAEVIRSSGSLSATVAEYADPTFNPDNVLLTGLQGDFPNSPRQYRSIDNVVSETYDLYVLDMQWNSVSANVASQTVWNAFDHETLEFTDPTESFEDYRWEFLGALLYVIDRIYASNNDARIWLLGDREETDERSVVFKLVADTFNISYTNTHTRLGRNGWTAEYSGSDTDRLYPDGVHPTQMQSDNIARFLVGELLKLGS